MRERLDAYCTPAPDGGVHIDTGGMALDLITAVKAGGVSKESFFKGLEEIWNDCHVTVILHDGQIVQ